MLLALPLKILPALTRSRVFFFFCFLLSSRFARTVVVQVVSIVPYGAFVNIEGNIDGLVHISEMAVGRVDSVEDVCQVRRVFFLLLFLLFFAFCCSCFFLLFLLFFCLLQKEGSLIPGLRCRFVHV